MHSPVVMLNRTTNVKQTPIVGTYPYNVVEVVRSVEVESIVDLMNYTSQTSSKTHTVRHFQLKGF